LKFCFVIDRNVFKGLFCVPEGIGKRSIT